MRTLLESHISYQCRTFLSISYSKVKFITFLMWTNHFFKIIRLCLFSIQMVIWQRLSGPKWLFCLCLCKDSDWLVPASTKVCQPIVEHPWYHKLQVFRLQSRVLLVVANSWKIKSKKKIRMPEFYSGSCCTALQKSTFILVSGFDTLCPETTAAQSGAHGPKFVWHDFNLACQMFLLK